MISGSGTVQSETSQAVSQGGVDFGNSSKMDGGRTLKLGDMPLSFLLARGEKKEGYESWHFVMDPLQLSET